MGLWDFSTGEVEVNGRIIMESIRVNYLFPERTMWLPPTVIFKKRLYPYNIESFTDNEA